MQRNAGFPRGGGGRGRQLRVRGGGTVTYHFAKFPQKLHEIERIWTGGGVGGWVGGTPITPPLDPPLIKLSNCVSYMLLTAILFVLKQRNTILSLGDILLH